MLESNNGEGVQRMSGEATRAEICIRDGEGSCSVGKQRLLGNGRGT